MNSAVALGRLGADAHFLGRISRDAFGRQLRQHILEANVKLDLATESSQATSIAVVSLDEEGVASYTFHFNDTANFGWQIDDLPELSSDDWLHIASLSCIVSPGAEVLLDWMRDVPAGVSYDINVRPTVITDPDLYWSKVQPWLRVVGRRQGIVKASDEDIKFLAKADASGAGQNGGDPLELAGTWVEQYGLGLAVITTIVLSFIAGMVIERGLIRHFEGGDVLTLVIVTLGLFILLNSLACWIWGFENRGFPSLFPDDSVTLAYDEGEGVVVVTSGSHSSRLNVYSAEDFPRLPPLEDWIG
jgi:fructokinase